MEAFDDYAWSGGEEEDNNRYECDGFVVEDEAPQDQPYVASHSDEEEEPRRAKLDIAEAREELNNLVSDDELRNDPTDSSEEDLLLRESPKQCNRSRIRRVEAWEVSPSHGGCERQVVEAAG